MKTESDETMKTYIEKYADCQDSVPADERDKFRAYVEEGCEKEWQVALDAKAYGCYGGNSIFACDWDESLRCLLKLIELTEDPFYYNTVGYIYYYGRCNGGTPEYEKAFQYFAVGAAHGVFESMYKVADMFIAGKGCLKNPAAGGKIILSMYNENRDIFCDEGFDGKFADVALRVGGLFEKGIGVDQSFEEAYAFYLEAKLAIDKRVELYDFYGDKKVARNIEEALERVRLQLPDDYFMEQITLPDPAPMGVLLSKSAGLDITLEEIPGGYKLKAKGFAGEDASAHVIFNAPEMNYCKLINEVELVLDPGAEILTDISDMPYNALVSLLYIPVCLDNVMQRGDYQKFASTYSGLFKQKKFAELEDDYHRYLILDNGMKLNKVNASEEMQRIIDIPANKFLRNGIGHNNIKYDGITQIVTAYDLKDHTVIKYQGNESLMPFSNYLKRKSNKEISMTSFMKEIYNEMANEMKLAYWEN